MENYLLLQLRILQLMNTDDISIHFNDLKTFIDIQEKKTF